MNASCQIGAPRRWAGRAGERLRVAGGSIGFPAVWTAARLGRLAL